ncbi:low temperature requirement protein A [Mollicutes bacterium LVI A0078]|nr:low temperature requirement protein A [Mollicutes bacterium LVI A0075]WOO91010.1 low temperature requirement protein A [Mollicutes bacterium LVI A0078]
MIRQMFNKPQKFNKFVTRQVDPMELFWDLIFVVTLRYIIDAYVVNFSMFTFVVGLLVFLETYIFWTNINVYSVNFYDVSHNNRFLLNLMLSPLLIIAAITDYTTEGSIYFLALSLVLLKLMQAYIWARAIKVHKTDKSYRSLNTMYSSEIKVYLICALIAAMLFIVPHFVIPVLIILILVELLLPSYFNRKKRIVYAFDRILIAERYLLFIILIFGEGFIGVVHIFQHSDPLSVYDLARGLLIFWTLYAMFLKLYDEYTIHKERISTTFMIFLTTYVVSSMLLISALIVIGLSHDHVTLALRTVGIMGVIAYNVTYAYNSYRYLNKRKEHLLECDIKYYKRDLYQSIATLAVSVIAIAFISNTFVLLIVLCATIIYSTKHISIRSQIVEDIFEEDHKIVDMTN